MDRPLFSYALCLLAALLPACAGKRAPGPGPTRNRIVVPNERPDPAATDGARYAEQRPERDPTWFDDEITAIDALIRDGELLAALERIDDARAAGPSTQQDERLRELTGTANRAVLELRTLSATITAERDPIVMGEPLRVRIRVVNHTERPIRIPAQLKGTSGSVFFLEVTRRDHDINANIVSVTRRVLRPLARDLDLPPGGSAEQVLQIEGVGNNRGLDGFRIYTVGGVLRPVVQEIGGLRRWEPVRLEPGRLRSFRPNFEHLQADPVGRIDEAIRKNARVHLLTAAGLVRADEQQVAVDTLLAALRGDRPIDQTIFAALQHLTQIKLGRDALAWKSWWPRVRETFFEQRPASDGTDTPAFDGGTMSSGG